MNAVDLVDANMHHMLLMIQSWNWQHYFIMSQMTMAVNAAYNAHVMLVEHAQQNGDAKEFVGAPMSTREFREKLGTQMMEITLTGHHDDVGESPRKAHKRLRKEDGSKSRDSAKAAPATPPAPHCACNVHMPVRHNKFTVSDTNSYQRCAFCSRKSALHECKVCKVHLHAPTASGARFNTSGRDWTCLPSITPRRGANAPTSTTSLSMSARGKAARRSTSLRVPLA